MAINHGLTAAEVRVLVLMAKGMDNPAIASELYLAQKTVERRINDIYDKLRSQEDVQGKNIRVYAVLYYLKAGVLGHYVTLEENATEAL